MTELEESTTSHTARYIGHCIALASPLARALHDAVGAQGGTVDADNAGRGAPAGGGGPDRGGWGEGLMQITGGERSTMRWAPSTGSVVGGDAHSALLELCSEDLEGSRRVL